jgi:hypothetical protein
MTLGYYTEQTPVFLYSELPGVVRPARRSCPSAETEGYRWGLTAVHHVNASSHGKTGCDQRMVNMLPFRLHIEGQVIIPSEVVVAEGEAVREKSGPVRK